MAPGEVYSYTFLSRLADDWERVGQEMADLLLLPEEQSFIRALLLSSQDVTFRIDAEPPALAGAPWELLCLSNTRIPYYLYRGFSRTPPRMGSASMQKPRVFLLQNDEPRGALHNLFSAACEVLALFRALGLARGRGLCRPEWTSQSWVKELGLERS